MDVIYVALYDLNAQEDKVLSFKCKDRFIPLTNIMNYPNWCYGVDFSGKVGLIPTSYVRTEPRMLFNPLQVPQNTKSLPAAPQSKTANRRTSTSASTGNINKGEFIDCIEIALSELERKCSGIYTKIQRLAIQELTTRRTLLLSPVHTPEDAKHEGIVEKTQSVPTQNTVDDKAKFVQSQISPSSTEENVSNHSSENHAECLSDASDTKESTSNSETPISQIAHTVERRCITSQASEEGTQTISLHSSPERNCTLDVPKIIVPVLLIPSLIENVRHETQLSHLNSKIAVAVVLDTLKEALPDLNELWDQLKHNLNKFEVIQEKVTEIESEDRRKLRDIFKQLWYCKNDEQQRSWPVHEDETLISSLLENLNTILNDADPRISKEAVQHDEYEMVNLLVTYYQMEPRRLLRIKMLHVFITLCKLDIIVVLQLLTSILPLELARDMQCTFEEFMDKEFFHFLLENFEETMQEGEEDIANNLLNIVLAFNLHFQDDQNVIFQTLREREYARMLPQKLILLVNREEDPVKILDNTPDTPNSVLKFMVDFFASAELVQLFYLNDIKVLLDIIIRQLTDYLPGEQKRLWYLQLVRNLLNNLENEVDSHHYEGLTTCFRIILSQEVPCTNEIELVDEIFDLCPELFSSLHRE